MTHNTSHIVWDEHSLKISLNELMNDRGDCRTAPATPGLLNTERKALCLYEPKVTLRLLIFVSCHLRVC